MKWIPALFLCALGLAFTACEKHRAEELEGADGAADAHPPVPTHAPAASGPKHDARPAEGAPAHGDAPKFFPEKK